jgi:hypothetical protein
MVQYFNNTHMYSSMFIENANVCLPSLVPLLGKSQPRMQAQGTVRHLTPYLSVQCQRDQGMVSDMQLMKEDMSNQK